MLNKIQGRKANIQVGENADVTMWNTGVEPLVEAKAKLPEWQEKVLVPGFQFDW